MSPSSEVARRQGPSSTVSLEILDSIEVAGYLTVKSNSVTHLLLATVITITAVVNF